MSTLVRFHQPFPFQLAFPLSFQLSSKRMPQTQTIPVHICITHMHFHFSFFPLNLHFLSPFNFHQSACLRHKQYLSTIMHNVHQPHSIPMTYASLVSPIALWRPFNERKNARVWTSTAMSHVLQHMRHLHHYLCYNTCLWRMQKWKCVDII